MHKLSKRALVNGLTLQALPKLIRDDGNRLMAMFIIIEKSKNNTLQNWNSYVLPVLKEFYLKYKGELK